LNPRLDEAKAGKRRVYFVDAAHFVFGTYLCSLWCLVRLWIPAASGRQRFNVLGAYDAISREMISITNPESVNTETMCDLVQLIERTNRRRKRIPITLVLDNARYQRNSWVQQVAEECDIELLFLPSYSPNLNLIERYWRLIKKEALYGRYYANFAAFRAGIEEAMRKLQNENEYKVISMMTLKFQTFENVSLQAA
jgi:transposase